MVADKPTHGGAFATSAGQEPGSGLARGIRTSLFRDA